MAKEIKRVPRPLGITALMVEYHKLPEEQKVEFYKKVKGVIIHHWIISNGNICGMTYSMDMLAQYLHCDVAEIQEHMKNRLLSTKIWDKDVQENMLNALMGQQVMWTMEDRMDIQSQLDILKKSQGNEYKAFVTAELNKALKLKLESTGSVQGLIKMFTGGTNNTLIFNQQNNRVEEVQGCNVEEAINIISSEISKLSLPPDKDVVFLEQNYDIGDINKFPQVIASLQSSDKGDKEGLNLKAGLDLASVDNYQFHRTEDSELEHHQLRREIEEGILVDEEDPELDMYDYPDLDD